MTPPYTRKIGIAIALVSGAVIQSEILLTRLLSVVVWYHFAFVAISIALFGLGVAAIGVHFAGQRLAPERTPELCALGGVACAITLVVVDIALLNVTPDWFGAQAQDVFTLPTAKLAALFLLASLPFCAGGFAIALALSRWSSEVRRLYFWDLLGAGIGGASVAPLLELMGAPVALLVPGAIGGLSALVLACGGRTRIAAALALGAPLCLALAAPATGWFQIRVAKGIPLSSLRPELNRWNSFSMVTVLPQSAFRGWAPSSRYPGPFPEHKTLMIDMNAMTPLTRFSGSLSEVAHLSFDLSAFVYRVRRDPTRVCVLGAGGGRDVLSALAAGADHVTAVEINPLIVEDVMRGAYRDYTGNLYGRTDVSVVIEDGRSFVSGSAARWDVIHLSMVDTSAATAAGAYALTENSLYTTEAFVELAEHLAPGGVLSVGSVSLPELAVGARLVSIARAAMVELGRDPAQSIAVIGAPWLATPGAVMYDVLVAPDGFDEAMRTRIHNEASTLGFAAVYVPGQPPLALPGEPAQIVALASADSAARARAALAGPLDVSATSDDRPFFFYQNRWSDFWQALGRQRSAHLFGNGMAILAKLLVVSLVLALGLAFVPALLQRSRIARGAGSPLADGAYVGCLGLGFMFVEIGILLRTSAFLGHPTATLTIVLLVLLAAGGIGSARLAAVHTPARATLVLAAVVVLAVAFALGSEPLLASLRVLPGGARAAVVALAIAPIGLVMGAPLPIGLGAVSARAPDRVAWLWAVNGATSVLASVLATLLALHFGIRAVLLAGAAIYALGLVLGRRVTRVLAEPAAALVSPECEAPRSGGGGPTSTERSTA